MRGVFMVKYKVEVDRNTCISTGACYTTDTVHYEADENQKSQVVGGNTDNSKSTKIFDDDQIKDAKEGAKACPVSAITVTEL
jgi:ferredoxin